MNTSKKKKSIADKVFGPKDPNFKRPEPVKMSRPQMATHAATFSNGQPRPHKRTGKTR